MELPKRKQNRLNEYDYTSPNAYFVTICTNQRKNLFWESMKTVSTNLQNVQLSKYGIIADQSIRNIAIHYPSVTVDTYVIMPNYVHLLLQIHSDVNGRPLAAPTVSTIVNQMKGTVSKKAGFSVWQKGFHDHVIRGNQDYREIWEYIETNPVKWMLDKFYTESV